MPLKLIQVIFLVILPLEKAYKVFNSRTKIVEETLNVKFNESQHTLIPAHPAKLFDLDSFHFRPEKTVTSSKPTYYGDQRFDDEDPAPWTPQTVIKSTFKPLEVSQTSDSTTADVQTQKSDSSPTTTEDVQTAEPDIINLSGLFDEVQEPPTPVSGLQQLIEHKDHPLDQIMGDITSGVLTRN